MPPAQTRMSTISKAEARRRKIPKKSLQTILIPKTWTLAKSRAWLQEHNYITTFYRSTPNFRRFLQVLPIRNAIYFTTVLPNGVELVSQSY